MKKMIVKMHLSLLFFTVFTTIQAQQQEQYSQYMLNYYLINPAAAGMEDYTDLRSGYRQQWQGLEGAPTNMYITINQPLNKVHSSHNIERQHKKIKPYHVVGGAIQGQQLGALSSYNVRGTYGYHLPLTQKWVMSGAAAVGFSNTQLNSAKIDFVDEISDAAGVSQSTFQPDINLGVWIYSREVFVGLSSSQLLQTGFGELENIKRHFYFTGGYNLAINENFKLVPSFLLKSTITTATQIDLNLKAKWMNRYWLGAGYRGTDAFVFMGGITLKDHLELGYSYDVTQSKLKTYSNGSHELVLALKLNQKASSISPSDFW